jgi:hypothetical protein
MEYVVDALGAYCFAFLARVLYDCLHFGSIRNCKAVNHGGRSAVERERWYYQAANTPQ